MCATRDAVSELVGGALPVSTADRRGCDDHRDQIRLRLSTDELRCAARHHHRAVRVEPSFLGAHALPRISGQQRRLYRPRRGRNDPRRCAFATAVDAFARASAFACAMRASCRRGRRTGWHRCTPNKSALGGSALMARTARCRRIISNMRPTTTFARWPRRAPSPCCCPAPIISCARRSCRRWMRCAARVRIALATDRNPGTSPTTRCC